MAPKVRAKSTISSRIWVSSSDGAVSRCRRNRSSTRSRMAEKIVSEAVVDASALVAVCMSRFLSMGRASGFGKRCTAAGAECAGVSGRTVGDLGDRQCVLGPGFHGGVRGRQEAHLAGATEPVFEFLRHARGR